MKLATFAAFFGAVVGLAQQRRDGPLKGDRLKQEIDMDVQITFSWCRRYNQTGTCGTQDLYHAQCYDFPVLDPYLNDNLEDVSVVGGRCVIWEVAALANIMITRNYGCKGPHTGAIVGEHLYVDYLCPQKDWPKTASSIKCCGGDPGSKFCADPWDRPTCSKK
ncbi:hypothetical protein HJFPF1_11563 [Paramyrothecium foliicola]|nr:hypothetical protein HJFPF1_11563 [Paramyrothecium foliicola]